MPVTAKSKPEPLGARNRRYQDALLKAALKGKAPPGVALRRILTAAVHAALPGGQKRRHVDATLEKAFRAARDAVARPFEG